MSDSTKKILIIEEKKDDLSTVIYQKAFSDAGFEVAVAHNGEEALEMIKKQKLDLILANLYTSEKDGLEITKEIRKSDKDIKIVVIACVDMKEYMGKALEAGANDFIDRTLFSPFELVDRIKKVLNNEKLDIPERLFVGKDKAKVGDASVLLVINNPFKSDSKLTIDFFREGIVAIATDNEYDTTWFMSGDQYDLVLFDIALGGDEGMRILKWIKYDERTKCVPVVIFTDKADEKMIKHAKEIGALDFGLNPKSTTKELAEQIKEILSKIKK